MPFTVKIPPDVLAMAHYTAEHRPKNIKHHKPSTDPHADLVGAIAEHAFAYHCGIPQSAIDSSGGPHGRGDGGKDFTFKDEKIKVDIKSSRKHPESWVVPLGDLRSDWYVFAYVILPDTVIFQGMAHKDTLMPMTESGSVPGKRLVYLTEVTPIEERHFKKTIPRRPKQTCGQAAS
jgi:hypothetical protein